MTILIIVLWTVILVCLGAVVRGQQDVLGLKNGYLTLETDNFTALIVRNAQVLASLKPAGEVFDFLPYDYLSKRAANGQYHWGDVTYRYRQVGATAWQSGDSAASRKPVTALSMTGALASSDLTATLPRGDLNISREWLDVGGDLGLRFTLENMGSAAVEIGSLGFPAEVNSIFTNRKAADMQRMCSLIDPYVGMHAGHLRVAPLSGNGSALVVTPLSGTDTPMEAWRNLNEPYYQATDLGYESQTFEGFYEWQVLTKAWAESEWAGRQPWNPPSSRILQPGESMQVGVRFTVVKDGVRDIDNTIIRKTGTPVAVGVPGYIVPRDLPAQLFLYNSSAVVSMASDPAGALTIAALSATSYQLTPYATSWGRVRLDIRYADNRNQTVHYFITKPATDAVGDLGKFLTTEQWFSDTTDPFGRAPSVLTYDYQAGALVKQDNRVWIAGLSDEGGAGSFLAATMKQSIQPSSDEITKLEAFVNHTLWGMIQNTDYSVRKSLFFYQPALVPSYRYNPSLDWTGWMSWNRQDAFATDRAYDYVHVAAAYWALYRAGRAYPDVLKIRTWDWYLSQAYQTIIRAMQPSVGYNDLGLMGETVFGQVLADLQRENKTAQASALAAAMKSRASAWSTQDDPFGSEMSWDSTGEEGVYYWSKYFGYTSTATKALNNVLGFMPTVPHWGWNGNARRYWDNIYAGKLERIERQIHHYASALNGQVLLSAFRSDPSDSYLLRVGYAGLSGPLSSINAAGFAAASFHSFPDTLDWDGYSGDYGPGFAGLALSAGTYIAQDAELGLIVFGGVLAQASNGTVSVQTRDAARRRVFIGPLGLMVEVDAGIISDLHYDVASRVVEVTIAQLEGAPKLPAVIMWVESTTGSAFGVMTPGLGQYRGGWQISLSSGAATVQLGPS